MNRLMTRIISVLFLWASMTMTFVFYHIARYGIFQAVEENMIVAYFELIMTLVSLVFAIYLVYRVVKK